MQVFVYEHLCGGALAGLPAASSLQAEGWAMLAAVVEDFARCPGVEPITLLDPGLTSLAAGWPAGVRIEAAGSAGQERRFRALAAAADWTLVVAPEFDGILAARCRWVEESGGRLLGPAANAVLRTADKLELSRWFLDNTDIPTPPALPLAGAALPPWPLPWVCKPRDGAGSQATFLVEREEDLSRCLDEARAEGWHGEMIVQPYVRGRAASVACLVGPHECIPLPAAEQCLSADGRLHYEGGSLPLPPPWNERAQRLAGRAVRAVPGLRGYVGVDAVLGEAADGRGDAVIEINPRLTTSYVGLRRLARFNLAGAMLAVATGAPFKDLDWCEGPIRFRADGRLRQEPDGLLD
jgi:predicted ATP-grasp superfamily ATP-dependent carboligase